MVLRRLVRRFSIPLDGIRDMADRYAAGNFDISPHLGTDLQFAEVAETLTNMASGLKKRIEILVRQRNEQKAILSGMVEAVIVLNPSLEIVEANPAAAELMRIAPGEAKGRSLIDLLRNPELLTFARETLETDNTRETEILLSGDPPRYLQVHAGFIGRFERLVLVLHDITTLKTLERIRQDFVANVSHELKTPITSIKGFIETLKEGAASTDPTTTRRFLDIVEKQSERMEAIIEDLLSLSRLERTEGRALSMTRFDLRPVIESATALAADNAMKSAVTVALSIPESLSVIGNPSLIVQAVVNLLDNAVKFSRPGGRVTVDVHVIDGFVEITVRDEGIGITAKELPRIFERFYRVDRARSRELGGTGLGLAIVKHIALVHGGEVLAESTIGVGSTFILKLPNSRRPQG
jgi:two-component system phosphate regulon sensor histidine kinase PhoR